MADAVGPVIGRHARMGAAGSRHDRGSGSTDPADYREHIRVYRGFVTGCVLFIALAAVVLAGLAYFLT